MSWRLAKSLERLRAQVNAAAPNRDKSSDGTIGDEAHSNRASDHNKDSLGRVCAIDITHDPKGGLDSYALAEKLRKSGDSRIKYIISNGKIANSGQPWRKYSGSNPHDHHVHVSVNQSGADDPRDWNIGLGKAGIIERTIAAVTNAVSGPKKEYSTIKRGSKGEDVRILQEILKIDVDGDFGKKTETAVKLAQKKLKIVSDGVCGAYTWRALGA